MLSGQSGSTADCNFALWVAEAIESSECCVPSEDNIVYLFHNFTCLSLIDGCLFWSLEDSSPQQHRCTECFKGQAARAWENICEWGPKKILEEVISASKISLHLETENLLLPKPALSAFCQQRSSGFPFPINVSCDLIVAKVKPWQGLKANREKWGSRAKQRGHCYMAIVNSGRMLQLKHEPPSQRGKPEYF